jgi:small GTP-binding protein
MGFKVVFLGDAHTGKTSLMSKRLGNAVSCDIYQQTVISSYHKIAVNLDGKSVQLDVWDTAGQEVYAPLASFYARGARVGVIVAAINDPLSIKNIDFWIGYLHRASVDIPVVIAINKNDLGLPSDDSLDKLTDLHKNVHFVSALTGDHVDDLFTDIARVASQDATTIPVGQPVPLQIKAKCC